MTVIRINNIVFVIHVIWQCGSNQNSFGSTTKLHWGYLRTCGGPRREAKVILVARHMHAIR